MSEETYTPMSNESFNGILGYTVEEEADILVDAFKTVATSVCLYYDISYSQGSGACWTGELDLETFVENLPKLKEKYSYLYNYFIEDYEGVIDEAKRLIAKLKLRSLPFPWITVEHNNSQYYHEKTMEYSIYVEDMKYSAWDYFYDTSVEDDTEDDIRAIEIETEKYLDEVGPVLTDICEMFALVAYKHLLEVSDSLREEYS